MTIAGSVPQAVSPLTTVEDYLKTREHFITEERSLRRDRIRLENVTADERRADEIIRAIKAEEEKTVWSVEHEGVPNTFPGMAFLSGDYARFFIVVHENKSTSMLSSETSSQEDEALSDSP